MAAFFLVSNGPSLPHSRPFTFASHASFGAPPFPKSPIIRIAGGDSCCRKVRGSTVVTRAGPSTSSYVFAFALPLSLLAVTVFASIRIADKLDRDFLEEMAMNEAIMEAEEDEDDDVETYLQEEPALPRSRNRPKREA